MKDSKQGTAVAPWKVLESQYAYRDRWIALRSDKVELPNGHVLAPYHVIEQPDWVTALALTHDGNIILIEEYRHGCQQTVVELPSGTPFRVLARCSGSAVRPDVRIGGIRPGCTELTLMPSLPCCAAAALVRSRTAPLEAL